MTRLLKSSMIGFMSLALLAGSGCSLFTASSLATSAGTEVGKRVVKKIIRDREQRKYDEEESGQTEDY